MKSIETIIKEFHKTLPKFPDGRIDYHTSDIAPVVSIFVESNKEILLLKRSDKVRAYQNKWMVIAGYLDDLRPVKEKVIGELKEEIGIKESEITGICFGEILNIEDKEINMTWISQPVLVKLKNRPEITIDWEHSDYEWVDPKKIIDFDIIPSLQETFESLLKHCSLAD